MKKKLKALIIAAGCFIIHIGLILFVLRCLNAGVIMSRPFDPSVLKDENIVRKENQVEKMTDVIGIVSSFTSRKCIGLKCKDYDGTLLVYLKELDIEKLNIGDRLTIRGRKYYNDDCITVGNSIGDFKAKILLNQGQ